MPNDQNGVQSLHRQLSTRPYTLVVVDKRSKDGARLCRALLFDSLATELGR
jgi:hypothetical protein